MGSNSATSSRSGCRQRDQDALASLHHSPRRRPSSRPRRRRACLYQRSHLIKGRKLGVLVRPGVEPEDELVYNPPAPQPFVPVDHDALNDREWLPSLPRRHLSDFLLWCFVAEDVEALTFPLSDERAPCFAGDAIPRPLGGRALHNLPQDTLSTAPPCPGHTRPVPAPRPPFLRLGVRPLSFARAARRRRRKRSK